MTDTIMTAAAGTMTLRDAAAKRNIFMGAAINAGHILNAPDKAQYNSLAAAQYSLATAENGCKWGPTEPQRGVFDFAQCDTVFNATREAKMAFRGHNLCWGNDNPAWLLEGKFSADQLRSILQRHVSTVMKGVAELTDSAPLAW